MKDDISNPNISESPQIKSNIFGYNTKEIQNSSVSDLISLKDSTVRNIYNMKNKKCEDHLILFNLIIEELSARNQVVFLSKREIKLIDQSKIDLIHNNKKRRMTVNTNKRGSFKSCNLFRNYFDRKSSSNSENGNESFLFPDFLQDKLDRLKSPITTPSLNHYKLKDTLSLESDNYDLESFSNNVFEINFPESDDNRKIPITTNDYPREYENSYFK